MTLLGFGRTVSVVGFVALLAGCNGLPAMAPGGISQAAEQGSLARGALPAHPDTGKSWVSPDIKKSHRLLFVTDSVTYDVYIYSLPSLKLKLNGVLTGFKNPQGACSDAGGDVWIANEGKRQMIELSHTGAVLRTIKDEDGYPVGCAVDRQSGDLAVMNLYGVAGSGASGSVDIYAGARGKPKQYTNPDQYYYYDGGYDPKGNLYLDGQDISKSFMLSELPKDATAAHTITVTGGVIYFPGLVQWNASSNELAVGDQDCNDFFGACIYQLNVSRSKGTIAKTTTVNNFNGGPMCDLVQGVISSNGKTIYGSDFTPVECNATKSYTYSWTFPAGGNPTKTDGIVDRGPIGAAISTK